MLAPVNYFDPFFLLLMASALVSFLGAYFAWRWRSDAGSIPLVMLGLCAGIWALCSSMEYSSPDLQSKLLWASIKYFGAAPIPVAMAVFMFRYGGWHRWPGMSLLTGLLLIPVATILIVFTNPEHHLFWTAYEIRQFPGYLGLQLSYGPWFWFHILYSYGLLIASASIVFSAIGRMWRVYSRQTLLLGLGLSFPLVANLLHLLGIQPIPGVDLSPVTFGLTAVFLFATTRLARILNVIPLAHTVLLEQLRDGLMVLDMQDNVLVMNRSAEELLEIPRLDLLGKRLTAIEHPAIQALMLAAAGETVRHEVQLGTRQNPRWFDMRISPILTDSGEVTGHMAIWHDVTDRKLIENELRYASTHDQLTGLYNRMFFDEEFDRVALGRRWPVAVLMVDIDGLKRTNDTLGHAVGDELLRQAADVLRQTFRQDDLVARFGGDEFAMVIANCDETGASQLIARLREAVVRHNELKPVIPLGFSMGYAIANQGGELQTALAQADAEMYTDKHKHKKN